MYKRERYLEDINLEEAREFLEEIYRTTNGNILIVVLDKSKGTKDNVVQSYAVDDATLIDFEELAEYNKKGYDIYYAINTRSGSRNTKNDVFEVSEFFVDVDAKDFKGDTFDAYMYAYEIIQQHGLHPTYVVHSGHGYHLHLLLKDTLKIDEEVQIDRVESCSRALDKLFRGDRKWNINSLSRIPGFYNMKDLDNPKLVKVEFYDPSKKYTVQDIEHILPVEQSDERSITTHLDNIHTDIPEKFQALLDQDPSLKARWNGNTNGLSDPSGSGIDMSIANRLAREGFNPQDTAVVLLNAPYDKTTPRTDAYIKLTVSKAYEGVATEATAFHNNDFKKAEKPLEFPLELLPIDVQEIVTEIADSIPCPIDYVTNGLLPYCASAIGGSRILNIKGPWYEESKLWCVTIAPSGEGKSPAVLQFNTILDDKQELLDLGYEDTEKRYKTHKTIYDSEIKKYKIEQVSDIHNIPIEPAEPPKTTLNVTDVTTEALKQILKDNPRGIICCYDEFDSYLKSMNQYKGHGDDRQFWNKLWNSRTSIVIGRVHSKKPYSVRNPIVSIHGNITPICLSDLTYKGGEDGLISRFL